MAQPATIYYGQRAYEGFARAFASLVGVTVSVGTSNGAPHVDASGVIHLPDMHTYQTKEQFQETCATLIHEIAHVVYGSHLLFELHKHCQPRLWMECLNAILDIADETAIGVSQAKKGNSRANQLLISACVSAGKQPSLYPNPYKGQPNNSPAHWRILATGIIKSRITGNFVRGSATYGKWLIDEFPNLDIPGAFTLMARARGGVKTGRRLDTRMLVSIIDKLYQILLPIAPPNGEPQPMPGGGNPASGNGARSVPSGASEATDAQVEAETGVAITPGGTGAGGKSPVEKHGLECDRDAFDMLLPIVKRISQRIATDGDSINNEGGYSAGMGVRDAYRIATDGQCMGRWTIDEHSDGMAVAVLLDCSGSMMGPGMALTAGVAEAFALGMEDCAVVKRWIFSSHCRAVESFSRISPQYGGTGTTEALETAREWLNSQTAGRKVMVCLTDGAPDEIGTTRQQVALAISEGISVIAAALGDCETEIQDSMPGASIFAAKDTNRLAITLEGISLNV